MKQHQWRVQIYSDWTHDWKIIHKAYRNAAKLPGWNPGLHQVQNVCFATTKIPQLWKKNTAYEFLNTRLLNGRNIKQMDSGTFLQAVRKIRDIEGKGLFSASVELRFRLTNSDLPPNVENRRDSADSFVWNLKEGRERLAFELTRYGNDHTRLVRNYNALFGLIGCPVAVTLEGGKVRCTATSECGLKILEANEYGHRVLVDCDAWKKDKMDEVIRAVFERAARRQWGLDWNLEDTNKEGRKRVGGDLAKLTLDAGLKAELYHGAINLRVLKLDALPKIALLNVGYGEFNHGTELVLGSYKASKSQLMSGLVLTPSGPSLGIPISSSHIEAELGPDGFRLNVFGAATDEIPMLEKVLGIELHNEEV
jgi:hypothetical protein